MADGVSTLRATQASDLSSQAGLDSRPPGAGRAAVTRGGRPGADAQPRITGVYWPCLLRWVRGQPTDATLERIRQVAARRWGSPSVLISIDRATQVLLFAGDSLGGPDRERLRDAVSAVVEAVQAARSGVEIQAV